MSAPTGPGGCSGTPRPGSACPGRASRACPAARAAASIPAGISSYFGFRGGSQAMDGACASSLQAIASACTALAAHDVDVALAGGVDLSLDPLALAGRPARTSPPAPCGSMTSTRPATCPARAAAWSC